MTAPDSTAPVVPAGVGFTLRVPPGWRELPLDPEQRQSALQELLDEVRQDPQLREHRTTVSRLLQEQTEQAWLSGALFAASMVEPTDDGPILASAVVQVVPGPLGAAPDELLEALAAPLPPVPPTAEDEPWRETSFVDVPTTTGAAVRAVRAQGIDDVELADGDRIAGVVRLVLLQLLVPLPHGRTLMLTCSSPVLPLQDVLLDLFDAVAGTLRIELPQETET